MERDQVITLNPVSHPDRRVRQVGFGLTDPYVEQCWSAVVGPSTTLLLRRLPELCPLAYTLGRLVRFRFARPVGQQRDNLDVFVEVAPLMAHQLAKVPQWTRNAHDRLLDAHLEQFDGVSEHQAKIDAATARLDRAQFGHDQAPTAAPVLRKSLER